METAGATSVSKRSMLNFQVIALAIGAPCLLPCVMCTCTSLQEGRIMVWTVAYMHVDRSSTPCLIRQRFDRCSRRRRHYLKVC